MITGLGTSPVTLLNKGKTLAVSANGSFVFADKVLSMEPYDVSVLWQPESPAYDCRVANGSGTVATSDVSSISVTCGAVRGRFMYAVQNDRLAAYIVDDTTGELLSNGYQPTRFPASGMAIDPLGRMAFSTSFEAQSAYALSTYALAADDGSLTTLNLTAEQQFNHPSGLVVDPLGRFVYHTRNRSVFGHAFDTVTGSLVSIDVGETFSGFYAGATHYNSLPRFHPGGGFAYVVTLDISQTAGTLHPMTVDANGAMHVVAGASIAIGRPGATRIDEAGQFVFQATNDINVIHVFRVNLSTGALTPVTGSPFAVGTDPVFEVSRNSRFFYIRRDPDTLDRYSFNRLTGALTAAGSQTLTGVNIGTYWIDPSGRFLYVSDAAAMRTIVYNINPASGTLTRAHERTRVDFFAYLKGTEPVVREDKFAFVAGGSGGIVTHVANPDGSLAVPTGSPRVVGAGPLALSTNLRTDMLLAASAATNQLAVFRVDRNDGSLTAVNGSPYGVGGNPRGAVVSGRGTLAYVINSASDSISAFSVDPVTKALTPLSGFPVTTGAGSAPAAMAVDPTLSALYVLFAGSTAVRAYAFEEGAGAIGTGPPGSLNAGPSIPVGLDPRAVVLGPTGEYLYVPNAGSDNLTVLRVKAAWRSSGIPAPTLSEVANSPFPAGDGACAVAVHPSGRFVYVADCNGDSVSAFVVDRGGGGLTPIAGSPFATGAGPVALAVEAGGRRLRVANSGSNSISIFSIDGATGALTAAGSVVTANAPASIVLSVATH